MAGCNRGSGGAIQTKAATNGTWEEARFEKVGREVSCPVPTKYQSTSSILIVTRPPILEQLRFGTAQASTGGGEHWTDNNFPI
jgi:hypothetical protein